jgi:hypothetical protein
MGIKADRANIVACEISGARGSDFPKKHQELIEVDERTVDALLRLCIDLLELRGSL